MKNFPERRVLSYLKGPKITLGCITYIRVLSKQAKCRQTGGYNHCHILVCCRNKRIADKTAVTIIVTSWRETARNTVIFYLF